LVLFWGGGDPFRWNSSEILFRFSQKSTPAFNMSGIINSVLYVQTDATNPFPGNEPVPQEKLIRLMEISGTDLPEERIAALEQNLRDLEPLIKGLIAELLDFKAVAMSMSRQAEESDRQEFRRGSVVVSRASPALAASSAAPSDGTTIIRPRTAHEPAAPVAPAEPEMVRIMQTDGTMKMEARYGGSAIDSSGYGRNRKGALASKQDPLIYAADDPKAGDGKK
jgi:hypothetical protein